MSDESKSKEKNNLFRMRKTITKMLADRGYLLSELELGMTFEQFQAQFPDDTKIRSDMEFLVAREEDPTDMLFVYWPREANLGVSAVKECYEKMSNASCKRAILVISKGLTSFAKTQIDNMKSAKGIVMEQFLEKELLVNITEHTLVPKHKVMSDAEKTELLARYKLKETQLPRIQFTDPIARYYGLARGQVVRIVRQSETAGWYVTYRKCW